MADNFKIFMELVARTSGFKRDLTSSKNAVSRFAAGARQEVASLGDSFRTIHGQLAALGLSVGAVKTIMDSARLDKSLGQIGQTAGVGSGQVLGLRQDLFRLGKESGANIEVLRDGFNNLVQSGLGMGAAKETLDGINTAMAVTGATADTLAGGMTVAAQAFEFDLKRPGQALGILDRMTVAGRLGNAELESLSDIFARVGVNAASAGMGFDQTLAFVEGLSMIEKNPERLATLADSTLRVFTNLRYMASAQKATGVKFFDAKGERRDAFSVLEDIKKKYDTLRTDQAKAAFIQKAFGAADLDTIKGIRTMLQGESLGRVREFAGKIADAGGTLKRDFDQATNNLVDQSGRLRNVLREAADDFAEPIKDVLKDLIKWSLDKKENGGLELSGKDMIGYGAGGLLGTMLAARYGSMGISALAGKFLKGGSSVAMGVAQGKALEAAAGIQPVFVTNWPAGGINGAVAETAAGAMIGSQAGKVLPWVKRMLPMAGNLGLLYAAGAAGFGFGKGINAIMAHSSVGEGWLGEMLYDVIHGREVKNDIELNVAIDERGRVTTKSSDMNTRATVNPLKRGEFGQWQTASAH